MTELSLAAEYIAIILAVIITTNFYEGKYVPTPRRKLFEAGLLMALLYILLDVLCVNLEASGVSLPVIPMYILNMVYFMAGIWLSFVVGLYVFSLLLEHVYDKSCERRAHVGLLILTITYTLFTLGNPFHHLMFHYDEQGVFCDGPLVHVGYAVLLAELVMMLLCYRKNKKSISKDLQTVMILLTAAVLVLFTIQLFNQQIILNGTIAVLVLLILFTNFQGMKGEQDNLTKLGSRKCLFEELKLRLSGGQHFQLILVMLQNFTAVNQYFGYSKGDEFLYAVADWLDDFEKGSKAFRFSGVCFAIFCPYGSQEEAEKKVGKVKERFTLPWKLGEMECVLDVGLGSLLYTGQEWKATQVVELLAQMQEEVKTVGNGQICYGNELVELLERRKYLSGLLRDAAKEDRFQIWYQPVFDCARNRFTTAEALVRLVDYDDGLISPAEFIPLAEKNGMIVEISWIILDKVCRFLGENKELPIDSISVNFSMQQFMDPQIYDRIESCLKKYGVAPGRIKVEITERVFLYDQEYMCRLMDEMTQKGIGFYLDDFGTGYSNLASVMHMPFECIKLDKSLFDRVGENRKDELIVRTMTGLFGKMGMSVIAEGIETDNQLAVIRRFSLNRVQGYVYARPMPEERFMDFLRNNSCNE